MQELHNLARHILLIGLIYSLVLIIGQFSVKQKRHRHWLIIYLHLCLVSLIFSSWNTDQKLMYVFPQLSSYDIPLWGSLGATIYCLIKVSARPNNTTGIWLHFLAVPAMYIISIPYFLSPSAEKVNEVAMAYQQNVTAASLPLNGYVFIIAVILNIVYVGLSLRMLKEIWSLQIMREDYSNRLIAYIVGVGFLVAISSIFGLALREYIFLRFNAVVITLAIIGVNILRFRYPALYEAVGAAIVQLPDKKKPYSEEDFQSLKLTIDKVMTEDKPFLDENLSLGLLAQHCSVNLYQLSNYLNNSAKKNFYQFVNEYRVEEAKDLLSNSDESILTVAYKVGFNAKSSFNRVFKQMTGLTPTGYRESKKEKSHV